MMAVLWGSQAVTLLWTKVAAGLEEDGGGETDLGLPGREGGRERWAGLGSGIVK